MKHNGAPDTAGCNLDILELLPVLHSAVYQEPKLKGQTKPLEEAEFLEEVELLEEVEPLDEVKPPEGATRHVEQERSRRKVERALFEELSRYYELPPGKDVWGRPELLRKGEHQP